MRALRLVGLLAAMLLATAGSCEQEDPLEPLDQCGTGLEPAADLSGNWSLTARGENSGCDDPTRDGDFRIETQGAFQVAASGETLSLVPNTVTGGLSFNGRVNGTCVEFQLYEGDPATALTYFGAMNATGSQITGEVFNDDDAGCTSTGTFVVDVTN